MNNLIRLRDGVAEVCRDDPWQLLRELPDALPPGPLLLPLAAWLERRGEAGAAAPWLAPDDEVEALLPHFAELPLIAVDFPSFRRSACGSAWPIPTARSWPPTPASTGCCWTASTRPTTCAACSASCRRWRPTPASR